MLNLLRDHRVVVRKRGLTPEQDATLTSEYEAGVTMAEPHETQQLSREADFRALHRMEVEV